MGSKEQGWGRGYSRSRDCVYDHSYATPALALTLFLTLTLSLTLTLTLTLTLVRSACFPPKSSRWLDGGISFSCWWIMTWHGGQLLTWWSSYWGECMPHPTQCTTTLTWSRVPQPNPDCYPDTRTSYIKASVTDQGHGHIDQGHIGQGHDQGQGQGRVMKGLP